MNFKKHLIFLLAVLMLAGTSLAQETARVRFIHVMPDTPAMDVYVNNQLAAADLAYGDASSYLNVPSGILELSANFTSTASLAFSQTVSVSPGGAFSMVASSPDAPRFEPVADSLGSLQTGETRLSILHAIEGGPAVDVIFRADGQVIAENGGYGTLFGTFDISAGAYELALVPSGGDASTSIADLNLPLSAGTSSMVLVYGTLDDPQTLVAAAPTEADSHSGRVRFVHAVQSAAPMDLLINGDLFIPSLTYAVPSEHIALPAGTHIIALSLAGTEITLRPLNLAPGQTQTVVIMDSPAILDVSAFSDSLSSLDASSALVSLVNAIPDSTINALTLSSGATVAADLAFGEASSATNIVTGRQSFAMNLRLGDETVTIHVPAGSFFGGSYYNLIALPGSAFSAPWLLAAETSILRGIQGETPAVSTASDSTAAVPAPTAALTTDEAAGPTAQVTVNPDANLHLRQYPSVQARSLGLVPDDTILTVLGRRGPTEYYGGEPADEPVDLSDLETDPAEGLERFEDLEPADTWLYVTYNTPDGGIINAWMNALYLQVFDEDGERQRLASLDMVRQNRAGAAISTSITSPQPTKRVTARVYNLNPGVHLNIRIANYASSEIIGRAGGGAMLSFLGLDENEEWAFIEYQASENVTIIGWVSTQYVRLQLDGNPIEIQALKSRDARLVPLISSESRGSITVAAGGEAPPQPTRDPFLGAVVGEVALNPEANLHLRNMPSTSAASLDLIPSGTRLIVDGMTESGEWLKVTYEGAEGWVFAQYLALSFNNRRIGGEELERRLTLFDNSGNRQPSE